MNGPATNIASHLFSSSDAQSKVTLLWSHNPPGELAAWSRCYQDSASVLAQSLLNRSSCIGREAFPAVFLYRHALELCLKGLLLEAIALYSIEEEVPPFSTSILGSHELAPLATPLEGVFQRFSWRLVKISGDEEIVTYDELLMVAREFDKFDSKSFAFRYPVDKSFENALLPHSLDFNLRHFVAVLDPILDTLQRLIDAVNLENDFIYEQQFWDGMEENDK